MKRNTFVLLFCSLLLGIVVSCAPPPVDPDGELSTNPPGADNPAQNDPGSITEGNLTQKGPEETPEDSMKAHQEGTLPATGPLADVFFDFDRSELAPDARDVLQRNSDWIKQNPAVNIEIEGACGQQGHRPSTIWPWGARRAQAVKDYLVTLGNAPERLSTISYGEELPVCGVDAEECWQKNAARPFRRTGSKAGLLRRAACPGFSVSSR